MVEVWTLPDPINCRVQTMGWFISSAYLPLCGYANYPFPLVRTLVAPYPHPSSPASPLFLITPILHYPLDYNLP